MVAPEDVAEEPFAQVWPHCLLAEAGSPPVAALTTLNDALWMQLVDEAVRHDVAVYLHHHLRRLEVAIPNPAQERLRAIARQAAVASLRRTHELRQILSALYERNITPTLLKGAALAHTVYPTPACRTMVDFDLWLADEEMAVAQVQLEPLGYQVKLDPTRTLAFHRRYEGELVLVSPNDGRTSVELHWGAFVGEWLRRTAAVERAAVAARRTTAMIAGFPVQLLAPEDAFLQILLHAAIHHQMSHHTLRTLLELGLLLRNGADLRVIVERAHTWRIERVTCYVLTLMSTLLDTPAPHTVATLRSASAATSVLQQLYGPADVLRSDRLDRRRTRHLFLALLVDRPPDAATLFARMLWPEAEWLQLRYGSASPAVRFQHWRTALAGKL